MKANIERSIFILKILYLVILIALASYAFGELLRRLVV